MRNLVFVFFIGILISLSSCRKDFEFEPSTGDLTFSKEIVYLDTVFTNIGSSTYTLKVYNKSDKDIKIPKVQLGKGAASKYRMTIDGMTGEDADNSGYGEGKIFDNVELLANDSLYVFIETTADIADANPVDFLYTDQIQFDLGANLQTVELVTLVQDAIFIYPNRPLGSDVKETLTVLGLEGVEGHTLTDPELNWTNSKPYVVYGYAAVPAGKNLVIGEGTRVHFHADSGLVIDDGATLNINGQLNDFDADGNVTAQHEVTFEGDRLEPSFEDTPGQWGTVLIFSSTDNVINHLTLKNAAIGLYVVRNDTMDINNPKLNISDSQFYNCSNYGIAGVNATIKGENIVINSAGQASLGCLEGGNYNFIHSTFNNNWPSSKQWAVIISNHKVDQTVEFPLSAEFKNCIIYGTNQFELGLDIIGSSFVPNFSNCLIKHNDNGISNPNILYNFIRNEINGNIKNQNPLFKNTNKNKLNILVDSPAIGKGIFDPSAPFDILGNPRPSPSDIGAYQYVP
ncbi:MAG: hypothetical protein V4548_01445 [Bacteroidota bacterium]